MSNDNDSKPPHAASALGSRSREEAMRDVKWVAEYLRVSASWVYQATASGVLPCVRIGTALRFRKRDLDAWLNGGGKVDSVKLPSCR